MTASLKAGFTARLVEAVLSCDGGDGARRLLIGRAIADTLACAAAGFGEPVVRRSRAAYGGGAAPTWSGETCEGADAAVFINAVASHALDFDDVMLDSSVHASTVILPAILREDYPVAPGELIAAFGAGLVAARAIGCILGDGHYKKGWHATGTVGALAATAAAARLHRLDDAQTRAAFALAAAQAGGLKANFGTMAKPCHAGFGAMAAVRAVRLVEAGIDAAADVFAGPLAFQALYGIGDGDDEPAPDAFELRPDRLSLKLYPCCYAAHRLIGIALDARDVLGTTILDGTARVTIRVPAGSTDLIRHDHPQTPLQAKFSARYAVATALVEGPPTLASFEAEALARPGLDALLDRIVIEDNSREPSSGSITSGTVTLTLSEGAGERTFARSTIPGSPESPPTQQAVAIKIADCLTVFSGRVGQDFPPLASVRDIPEVATWMADPQAA